MNAKLQRSLVVVVMGLVLGAGTGCAPVTESLYDGADYSPAQPPAAAPQAATNGAVYQAGHNLVLFEDVKARRVGDTLTVLLRERTDASKSASSEADKNSSASAAIPWDWGGTSIEGDREFEGTGSSDQSNELEGKITVSVVDVLANGNLVIRGEKWIGINNGREFIRLRGIVRPVDVRPDNTIVSQRIANARIDYGGEGMIADSNRAGWLTRFFHSPLFPF